MKLKIKSIILKDIVNKVIKASTNNKMVPLTSLISINVKNGIINVVASDAINYFEVSAECSASEDFSVVVRGELFSKIVSKTTSEFITLELTNNVLNFTGNGTYKIDLPLDEEGQLIKYPVYWTMGDITESGTIKLATIKSAILANKPALALTPEAPYLMNYYCGDSIVSADSYNICINKVKVFENPLLLSSMILDLLSLFTAETIEYKSDGSRIAFTSGSMKLYAKAQKDIEEYPIDAIMGYTETNLPSSCAVSKSQLLAVVDRLSLFISEYDVDAVYLDFTKEGLRITSKNNSGSEIITYQESQNFEPFVCLVSVEALRKQANARSGDILYMQYGLNNALKFIDNDVIHIVALLEDDSNEDETAEVVTEEIEDVED